MLLRRWRHAAQAEGCVVVLTGEPGIGKSHIAQALQERLQAEPHIQVALFLLGTPHQQCAVPIHWPTRTGRPVRAKRLAGGKVR